MTSPPILTEKHYTRESAFTARALLREARRQKGLAETVVPPVCVLDPDGDIVRALVATGCAERDPSWACYHTDLHRARHQGVDLGVVGCAVGAPFAVLVAEELFESGCRLLVSITSAGQLVARGTPPYFILIDRALRDEGTSYHYLPPAEFAAADAAMIVTLEAAFANSALRVERGATWSTDAPFRETPEAIEAMTARGLAAVEMEAAALYAFAQARAKRVVCFAHVTNQMGRAGQDFEKGEAGGANDALAVIIATARSLG